MYRVHLEEFEGPLDLLLFFIKRDEVNIYDIPISRITEEFMTYLNAMKELDLEVAAEFIYMAALLISIKAKMLLPRPEIDTSELDDYDPRTELVQRLLEYKQIKEVSLSMREEEAKRRELFERGLFEIRPMSEVVEKKATLFDMIQAYLAAVEKSKNRIIHTVRKIPVTLEEQIDLVLRLVEEKEKFSFFEIIDKYPIRVYIVVTFLAVLELVKDGQVSIYINNEDYRDFWVTRHTANETEVLPEG